MEIERRRGLNERVFIDEYLIPNKPIILQDFMETWIAKGNWTPQHLRTAFGDYQVQVYNDLFDLVNVTSMAKYLENNFGKTGASPSLDYVRWYSKFRYPDFVWADEAFRQLRNDWNHPSFLPTSSYIIPFCPPSERISVVDDLFPYKGLFVSGKGARTRLHKDPWTSEAILCQFYGEKRFIMYSPDQEAYLFNGKEFVDTQSPDLKKFPAFPTAQSSFDDTLRPGEILFIPSGWFHEVISLSDSISVTWNFVYAARLEHLCRYLSRNPLDDQLETIQFFLSHWLPRKASADQIISFLEKSMASLR